MTPPALNTSVSLRVVYFGHVQGVGFRYTASHIARRHVVSGYVKNLADGTVELVVTGLKSVVDRFLDEIDNAFLDHITHKTSAAFEVTSEIEGFAIRRS
jgi:acylphosphatase